MASPATPVLDFSRVQYPNAPQPEPKHCHYCSRGLEGEYYKLQAEDACGVCVENVRSRFPADTHKAFSQALLWGIPAAVLGMIGYAAFEIVTNIEIGFVAIGVAWLISKAMLRGSGGARGRRYQITAVLLTYAAVSVAFIPMVIVAVAKGKHGTPQAQTAAATAAQRAESKAAPHYAPPQRTAEQQQAINANESKFPFPGEENVRSAKSRELPQGMTRNAAPSRPKQHGALYSILFVLGLGLISPFYELFTSFGSGAIGLFILLWGMQYAWKAMAAPKVGVDGPFVISCKRLGI